MSIKDKSNNILTTEREQYLRRKGNQDKPFQEGLNRKDPDELLIIPQPLMDIEIYTDLPSNK